MEGKEKSNLYNETIVNIEKSLEVIENELGRKSVLDMLAYLVKEQELNTASNLIKKDCEPFIDKGCLAEHRYDEGNEDAGYIDLSSILNYAEEILNCDDEYGDVKFEYFVRPENQDEAEENKHNDSVTWFVKDESVKIKDLQVQYEM